MAELAEIEALSTIEASVNYMVEDGQQLFTYTGGPGSTDIRTGGTPDPHTVTMHNGRLVPGGFALERNGCLRSHAAHRRRRDARGEEDSRSRAPRPQRLH
jgi:hypothetical protein